MRTFVALRKLMESNKDLALKIRQLERKYDQRFKLVFDTIQKLIKEEKEAKPIGFQLGSKEKKEMTSAEVKNYFWTHCRE